MKKHRMLTSIDNYCIRRVLICGLLVVTVLFSGWLNANAVEYYVSSVGNDAWDGKSAEYTGGISGPWKTLDRVNQQLTMPEGATISGVEPLGKESGQFYQQPGR